jgi:outer membrane lipoprotein SlyB
LSHFLKYGVAFVALAALGGCAPDYSPDTYSASAVQQANKVDTAVVVGFRQVAISAAGTVGAVTGGAAGGILGAQAGPTSAASALGAVGGGVVGSLLGTGIEHATADTTGWEYIVQKANGDLLSVTQREPQPIPLGQKVLVISGSQARIIPDYSVAKEPPPPAVKPDDKAKAEDKPKPEAKPVEAAPTNPPATNSPPVSPDTSVSTSPLPSPDATAAPTPPAPAASSTTTTIVPATLPHSSWDTRAGPPVPVNPAPSPEPTEVPPQSDTPVSTSAESPPS